MWNGIMKVLEIQHKDRNGAVLWEQKNVLNTLHLLGEEWLLRAAFAGGKVSTVIPDNYYLGLDNRSVIDASDTIDSLTSEPTYSGYERQPVASSGDFTVSLENDHYMALSPIVAFMATGGTWGPVQVLFLSDKVNSTGTLISSIKLDTAITVTDGQSVTMRLGMALKDCN